MLTVYHECADKWQECNFGTVHQIKRYSKKRIYDTGRRITADNGYYKYFSRVFVDYQGREYETIEAFDSGRISYFRLDDEMLFESRVKHPAEDLFGNVITG